MVQKQIPRSSGQEMKSHVLERIAKQVELASQDPPDIENMSAADLER
jgi:hypothetical protein